MRYDSFVYAPATLSHGSRVAAATRLRIAAVGGGDGAGCAESDLRVDFVAQIADGRMALAAELRDQLDGKRVLLAAQRSRRRSSAGALCAKPERR